MPENTRGTVVSHEGRGWKGPQGTTAEPRAVSLPATPPTDSTMPFPLDLVLRAEGGLVLSRPTAADADDLVAACNDPEVARFTTVPSPYSAADALTYERLSIEGAEEGTALNLLARGADGRVLASCGMPRVSPAELAGEVGYWVAPWARRQGVATRATRAVCRYAFEEAGLERLRLFAATVNPGSNAVAAALGFRLEGTLRQDTSAARGEPGGARHDMNAWGLLPGELT